MTTPAPTLRTLVAGLVDYAGLFPPAALTMNEAAASYAGYRDAPERWMLGRFVVPVARLGELADAVTALEATASIAVNGRSSGTASNGAWQLAALASGDDPQRDAERIREFNESANGRLAVDVVEARTPTAADIDRAAEAFEGYTLFCEIPLASDPAELLSAMKSVGARAKARTGGVTPDAFPPPAQLARFIARCAERRVPFKATAGLHHPLRASYRLTYDADAPTGVMYGFLNVFAAGAFARAGLPEPLLAELLQESDSSALQFGDAALTWRDHAISLGDIANARAGLAIAFGSCSFREPVDDLRQLGLL